jgi:L-alanine-DL-glutamate epimerase-like enolase superfamily enzyme
MSSCATARLPDRSNEIISEIRVFTTEFALLRPLHHATAQTAELQSVVVKVTLDDGATGSAEVRANGAYATGEDRDAILRALTELRVGTTKLEPAVAQLLRQSNLAAMVVDMAAWDALARRENQPLHQLWTGLMSNPAPIRTHGQINFSDGPIQAQSWVDLGVDRLKVRVGSPNPDDDAAKLMSIASQMDRPLSFIADANGGWTADQTRSFLRLTAHLDVVWLEQPTGDLRQLRGLRPTSTLIYADESARGAASLSPLAELVDGVHLKLEKAGTVRQLFAAVEEARAHGLAVALGQMDQGQLGCSATVQLAAALGFERAEIWGCAQIKEDLSTELQLVDGCISVPSGPGNGLTTLNEELLLEVS